jgi:multidrug resistance efflux pump
MPQKEKSYSLDDMLKAAKIERLDEADRIYSHEVREIISSKPVWIVRYGIALFFLIIGLLFILTFFIRYPDLIKAPVRIVGKNLPKQVISKTEGSLVLLAAKENSRVHQGDLLGILQSNADYTQVLVLKEWIEQVEQKIINNNWTAIKTLVVLNNLGDLQKNYLEIQQQLYQLSWSQPNGYFEEKKATIAKDLAIINQLQLNGEEQKKLIVQDLDMQRNLLGINEKLAKEKIIAPLELNKDKTIVLAKQQQLVQVDAGTINQTANALSKEKELIELKKNSSDIRQNFITALLNAKSSIAEWTNRYMLIASETGRLQYINYFQKNSWVKVGQELFYIIPEQPEYFAEIIASQQNFGKLTIGQSVNIALNSYQRNEYGVLKGVIENIPAVPYKDSVFLIRVQLSRGLNTNYNRVVQFSNNLMGTAEVITAEATLADRLFYQWRGLFRR